jgi:hypothetical protein
MSELDAALLLTSIEEDLASATGDLRTLLGDHALVSLVGGHLTRNSIRAWIDDLKELGKVLDALAKFERALEAAGL